MIFRLPTVRSKLTALVATTLVLMLATLPVLSWVLHKQLVDEVDDRVEGAQKSFHEELVDDLADLELASRVLAGDSDTIHAIEAKDADRADDLAQVFLEVYPTLDVLITDADGKLLAQVGCKNPVTDVKTIPEFAPAIQGQLSRGFTHHGCEKPGPGVPPAYVIAAPVKDKGKVVGTVVVCMELDHSYFMNAADKLGLELAAIDKGEQLDRTDKFPNIDVKAVSTKSTILEGDASTFAMIRFAPPLLKGRKNQLEIVAAMDVSDIKRLVRNNLIFALVVLGLATAISIGFGFRLARIMSTALSRVNAALKKLEVQEYVHVDTLKTGDELEDLANGFNLMVDGLKERDKLRTTFGKYMTASVVEHLMSGKVQLGGEILNVTILFTDIRSFTTISEKMEAKQLVALLNEYFTEMVGIVMEEEGVVDKYIGDAIMAVFGAPVPKPEDAIHAVRAAVRMRKALVHLNEKLATRGLGPLKTGIGIHTGEVVAGNIGSERRMEYTVIGDPVNVASRLETSTKDLGVNVLISEHTYQLVKEHIDARPVKEITVKGRKQPIMTYEVTGIVGEPPIAGLSDRPRADAVETVA